MGGVNQLDGYLNNLRPCIGGKKWYWMQLINLVRLLQVSAFRLFCHLHREKRFQSWSLYELLSINMLDLIAKPKDWMSAFRISCPLLGHYLAKQSQESCKFCQKNCLLICNACNVRLHLEFLTLHHTDWTELITLSLSPCWRNLVLPDYKHITLMWSYFLLYFLL